MSSTKRVYKIPEFEHKTEIHFTKHELEMINLSRLFRHLRSQMIQLSS